MEIQVNKETKNFGLKVATSRLRTMVETDVIALESRPDIGKVLQVDAIAKINGNEIQKDRVLIYGEVDFKVMYMPEDVNEGIKSITTTASFTDIKEIGSVPDSTVCCVEAETENVSFRVINARKLSVKASILSNVELYASAEKEIAVDTEEKQIQMLKCEKEYICFDTAKIKQFELLELAPIPASQPLAEDIVKIDVNISEYNCKVINNKVIIKGDATAYIVYTASIDRKLNSYTTQMPFTEVIDFDGVEEDMENIVNLKVLSVGYEIRSDETGDINAVNIKATVAAKMRAIKTDRLSYIKDCYSVSSDMDMTTEEIQLDVLKKSFSQQSSIKDKIFLADDMPQIEKIYDVLCDVYTKGVNISGTKAEINAVADVYLLYLTKDENQPISSMKKEIEFTESVECENLTSSAVCDIYLNPLNVSYNLLDNQSAEVRLNIKTDGVIYNKEKINSISCVRLNKEQQQVKKHSVTVYFPDSNDSLWKIAKKYKTSVDLIKGVNNIEGDEIKKGDKILIPKFKTTVI